VVSKWVRYFSESYSLTLRKVRILYVMFSSTDICSNCRNALNVWTCCDCIYLPCIMLSWKDCVTCFLVATDCRHSVMRPRFVVLLFWMIVICQAADTRLLRLLNIDILSIICVISSTSPSPTTHILCHQLMQQSCSETSWYHASSAVASLSLHRLIWFICTQANNVCCLYFISELLLWLLGSSVLWGRSALVWL